MADFGGKREVAECSLEYLLGEILNMDYLPKVVEGSDEVAATAKRLECIGYEIGYRYRRFGLFGFAVSYKI